MFLKTSTLHGQAPNPRYLGGLAGCLHQLLALVVLLAGLGVSTNAFAQSPSFYDESVSFTAQPTKGTSQLVSYAGQYLSGDTPYSTYEYLGTTATTNRPNPSLGTYDLDGNSKLLFTGASLVGDVPYSKAGKPIGTITAVRLMYRVYSSTASTLPAYTPLTLTSNSTYNSPAGNDSQGSPVYNGSTSLDLLNGLLGGGTYVVDLYYQIDYAKASGATPVTYNDPSSTYQATFTVSAPSITPAQGTSTWQGTIDSDWQKAGNWSNGVPNALSDAIIQEKTTGVNTLYPVLNDSSKLYAVRNLTLNGDLSSTKALLTVQKAVLIVYGNIQQDAGGLKGTIARSTGVQDYTLNSTLVLAGADQIITGPLDMPDVVIAGSGIKSTGGVLSVLNTLSFRPDNAANGALLQTARVITVNGRLVASFSNTSGATIDLRTTGLINPDAGETTVSYAKGLVTANRLLSANQKQTFGNIGIDLVPNHTQSSTANVSIRRNVGDPLLGPTPNPNGPGNPAPIKRSYEIANDDDSRNASTSNSTVDVIFHYLPSTDELNGIQENNLTMFRTVNNGVPYTGTGGSVNTTDHTFTRLGLPTLSSYTLTLGDKTNPLPVSLAAFTAVRSATNTLLSWTTATEENNEGFNVQVSADGVSFRTLGFVASQSSNSSQALNYKYTDIEAGKTGIRYYRLEQVDLSGKLNYSPVRAVTFDGAASGTLAAYPNPFTEAVDFTFDAAKVSDGTARVQLLDMTGRLVREQQVSLTSASLSLNNLSGLHNGLYLAKITLPDGTTQTLRVQKQ